MDYISAIKSLRKNEASTCLPSQSSSNCPFDTKTIEVLLLLLLLLLPLLSMLTGNVVFYDISSVLMSSSYFFNAFDAIRFYPNWTAAADIFSKAALYSGGIAESMKGATENTFLLPNNDALGNGVARALVNAPAGDLSQIVEYHVVPGVCDSQVCIPYCMLSDATWPTSRLLR